MTEPHFTLPKIVLQFGGKERFLCYTNRSLKRLKTEKNIDAIETFQKGDVLETIPLLLWCGFLWAEPDLPYDEIENYFLDCGGLTQNREWSLAIAEALTGEKPKEQKLDPPEADGGKS